MGNDIGVILMDTNLFIKKMQEIYRISNIIIKKREELKKLNQLIDEKMQEIFEMLAKEEKEKTKYTNCENSKIS